MSYTVLQLIDNAYFVSGIVAREFQQVTGSQEEVGLDLLNELLTEKTVENDMVPYFTKYNFTAVVGQETYFVPNLIDLDTLTFTLSQVRYQMNKVDRIQYFGVSRANDIQSLPVMYHVERQMGGANIYLYFLPDQAYPFEGWGRFGLTSVVFNQDLALVYDQFFINYLKYALAEVLLINYSYDVPQAVAKKLEWFQTIISKQSQKMDLTLAKTSTLVKSTAISYAQINLGRAWTVP